jgi:hypothetical protein
LLGGRFVEADFGGGVLVAADSNNGDVFLAKLTPAGAHVWSKKGNCSSTGRVWGINADAQGNVYASGWFSTNLDFGSGVLPGNGQNDFFAAKLTANGAAVWVKSFGDAMEQTNLFSKLDAGGNLLLFGEAKGVVDFGGGALPPVGPNYDVVVAKLDPTGAHVYSKRFGNGGPSLQPRAVATDSAGNAHFIGNFVGSADFGMGALTAVGSDDVFLLEYDPTGLPISTQNFGDVGTQFGAGIAIGVDDAPVISGSFTGIIDFGSGALVTGPTSVFVAKLQP